MTGLQRPLNLSPALALAGGLIATAVLVIWGLIAPRTASQGWLIGFATVESAPLGALALLAIHGLTGGHWGEMAKPMLSRAAMLLPLVFLAFLPLVAVSREVYPWAVDPAAAGADVGRLYLNIAFFALRSIVVLGLLSLFAAATRRGPLPSLIAAMCLLVYAIGLNLLAFDWLLSLDPHYNSSAFGVQIIVTQLIAGLSVVILTSTAPAPDPAWGDFGALLLACLLGLLYLFFMTFLIDWYGDLPEQAAWYLRRSRHGWLTLEIAGLLVGTIVPLLALLFAGVRRHPAALRLVAGAALVGVFLEMVWLVAPETGGATAAAGLIGTVAIGGLLIGLGPRVAALLPEPRSLVHER